MRMKERATKVEVQTEKEKGLRKKDKRIQAGGYCGKKERGKETKRVKYVETRSDQAEAKMKRKARKGFSQKPICHRRVFTKCPLLRQTDIDIQREKEANK